MYQEKYHLNPRFDLVRWFSIAGFIAISLLSAFTASFYTRLLSSHVLDHDAAVMTELVNSIIRVNLDVATEVTLIEQGDTQKVAAFFSQLSKVPGIIRANVYSLEHKILWSSDAALVNKNFANNDDLEFAIAGQAVAHLEDGDELPKEEHVRLPKNNSSFVEYYLPVWHTEKDNKHTIAVAEIYRVPQQLLEQLDNIKYSVWTSSLLGGLFLFGSLFWIVRRASNIIRLQDAQLLHTHRLATIGEMASTVAHSLRNPLANIRSSAELARENHNSDETNVALDQIMLEADLIEAWVRQYLEQFKQNVGDEACSLNESVDTAIGDLKRHPLAEGILFEKELADTNVTVAINQVLLVQIINGLLSNAIEAKPSDKKVIIRSRNNERRGYVLMQILDRGTGIKPADFERVFEPFVTTKRNGLGIGLSLTRQILERHKGSIDIQSDAVNGTVVNVHLPVITA